MNQYVGLLAGLGSGWLWAIYLLFLSFVLQPSGVGLSSREVLLLSFGAMLVTEVGSLVWLMLYLNRQLRDIYREFRHLFLRQGWLFLVCPLGGLLYIGSLALTTPEKVASITAVYPLITLLISHFYLSYRPLRLEILGICLAVIGLGLTGLPLTSLSASDCLGMLLGLGCAVAWGSEAVLCAHYQPGNTPVVVVLLFRYLCSVSTIVPIGVGLFVAFPADWKHLFEITHLSWLGVVSISGLLSYGCYYLAIHKLGPVKALTLNITYLCWVFLFVSFFGETPTIFGYVGVVLIFTSLLLANFSHKQSS